MLAQATQPIIVQHVWTPESINAIIGALTALIAGLGVFIGIVMKAINAVKGRVASIEGKGEIRSEQIVNLQTQQNATQAMVTSVAMNQTPPTPVKFSDFKTQTGGE